MLARLGQVIYWLSCGTSAAIIALLVWALAADGIGPGEGSFVAAFLAIAAFIWIIGRAARYVLGGT
jgi:hypothetical protein